MRRPLAAVLLASVLAAQATAQEQPPPSPILTIERDRLFQDSAYGRAVEARLDQRARELQAENRRIDAELEAEEKSLTDRRAGLPPDEFRALAETFDAKVERIRAEQEVKGRTLTQERDAERQKVIEAAVPVLADLMARKGAVAILDKSSVFLAFDRNDVTDEAIAEIDRVLGSGPVPGPAPEGAPPP